MVPMLVTVVVPKAPPRIPTSPAIICPELVAFKLFSLNTSTASPPEFSVETIPSFKKVTSPEAPASTTVELENTSPFVSIVPALRKVRLPSANTSIALPGPLEPLENEST